MVHIYVQVALYVSLHFHSQFVFHRPGTGGRAKPRSERNLIPREAPATMMAPQAKSTMVCQMFREAPLAPTEETLILGDLALPTINLPNKPKFCTRCYMRWNLTRLCSFFLSVQCGRDPSGLHHKVMLEPVQWLSCKKTHVPILRASSRFPWLKHHFPIIFRVGP